MTTADDFDPWSDDALPADNGLGALAVRSRAELGERGALARAHEGFAPRDAAQSFTIIAWSMVHGLAALWNSGRVRSRFEKLDPDVLNEQMNEALTTMMFPGRPVQK